MVITMKLFFGLLGGTSKFHTSVTTPTYMHDCRDSGDLSFWDQYGTGVSEIMVRVHSGGTLFTVKMWFQVKAPLDGSRTHLKVKTWK